MARDLFDAVSAPSVKLGSQAWYTVPLSIAAHVILAAIVIIVPLSAGDARPLPRQIMDIVIPPRAPQVPPSPPVRSTATSTTAPANSTAAPTEAPPGIQPEAAVPVVAAGPGVEGGIGSVGGALGTGLLNIPAPPSPPPVQAAPRPVRPGGQVKFPTKVRHVPPVYPRIAQDARVSGLVILEATIDVDGSVLDVRIMRSQPLLDQAAIDAVRQWRFTPTLLNGMPVPVLMTVTVNFQLQ